MMKRLLLLSMALAVCCFNPAIAAEYPERDLQGVIMWGAGGGGNLIIRNSASYNSNAWDTATSGTNMDYFGAEMDTNNMTGTNGSGFAADNPWANFDLGGTLY